MIKLNLGCGRDHLTGWINADIDPRVSPEIILDLTHNLPFKPNSVSLIRLQDVLEHLTKESAEALLRECHRILTPSGTLELRLPNIYAIIDQFSGDEAVMMEFIYGNTRENGVWGAHKYGYTPDLITQTLKRTGFSSPDMSTHTTNFHLTASKVLDPVTPKLLVFQQSPDWGGAESWMVDLLNQLHTQNIPITLYTNLPQLRNQVCPGIQTHHLPFVLDIIGNLKGLLKSIFFIVPASLWYLRLLYHHRKQKNIILMSGFSEKLLVSWLSRLFGYSLVWYEYAPLDTVFRKNLFLPKILYRLTKHLPHRVITLTRHARSKLITSARISSAKLEVIPPGTRSMSIKPSASLTVGHLSRLTPEKGQRLLLKAWRQVYAHIPRAKLLIAGSGPDQKHLQSFIHQYGLEKSVRLLGFVQDKSKFYQQLDLFVFPSLWPLEGFGLVLIESLAHGVPVVATYLPTTREIITSDTGIVLNKNTPQALSQAIIHLLSNSSLRKSFSQAGTKRVHMHYDLTTQVYQVHQLLNDVVQENR